MNIMFKEPSSAFTKHQFINVRNVPKNIMFQPAWTRSQYVMQTSKISLNSSQIQFSLFWLIVYIICKTTFYNRPQWSWSIGSKDTGSWRVSKTIGNKESICIVWLYSLKSFRCELQLILLDNITYERSYISKNAWNDMIVSNSWSTHVQVIVLSIINKFYWQI